MQLLKSLTATWRGIPKEIRVFLQRALIIFILWKLVYHLFLFNGRIIDRPLTDWSAKGAEQLMQWVYPGTRLQVAEECKPNPELNNELSCMHFLWLNGKKVVGIADGCNALELYVLYIGFLFAYPVGIKRTGLFILAGVPLIYIANIVRLAVLAYMNMHRISAVSIAHHYVFKLVVYALIFGLWVLFIRQKQEHATTT
jgi:exosortase family protein XrtF